MSRLHSMKKGTITPPAISGGVSNRAGTRTTRTRAKTARALGLNFTPTLGWRTRSQGQKSLKIDKSGSIKSMRKQALEVSRGDTKHL